MFTFNINLWDFVPWCHELIRTLSTTILTYLPENLIFHLSELLLFLLQFSILKLVRLKLLRAVTSHGPHMHKYYWNVIFGNNFTVFSYCRVKERVWLRVLVGRLLEDYSDIYFSKFTTKQYLTLKSWTNMNHFHPR